MSISLLFILLVVGLFITIIWRLFGFMQFIHEEAENETEIAWPTDPYEEEIPLFI